MYVNGYDVTLKKVVKSGQAVILQPLNPQYEPKVYTARRSQCLLIYWWALLEELRGLQIEKGSIGSRVKEIQDSMKSVVSGRIIGDKTHD